MIAFGASISSAEAYRRYAEPGIRRAAEPDSAILAFASLEPIGRAYNLVLDAAAAHGDLEALVLVAPHTEIADPELCAKIRAALADPEVAVLGVAGATGVRSIAWWEGTVTAAKGIRRYVEHGGGELPAFGWTDHRPPPADVTTVDGDLLVLSPWAVRNLRFDETLILGYGFDLDFCLQAGAAGRKVRVIDVAVVHHRSVELISDLAVWVEAHIRTAEKWQAVIGPRTEVQADWKRRARQAEARREVARTVAFSKALLIDARVLEAERALQERTATLSWRLTAPLRALNHRRREAARRPAPGGSPP
ncbi:MAG: glycosyltransferase family protein [Actinomycetota bacterium]|nr:glycosyltransferase family protein [Actinomycetota bacterium]